MWLSWLWWVFNTVPGLGQRHGHFISNSILWELYFVWATPGTVSPVLSEVWSLSESSLTFSISSRYKPHCYTQAMAVSAMSGARGSLHSQLELEYEYETGTAVSESSLWAFVCYSHLQGISRSRRTTGDVAEFVQMLVLYLCRILGVKGWNRGLPLGQLGIQLVQLEFLGPSAIWVPAMTSFLSVHSHKANQVTRGNEVIYTYT